MSVSFCSVSSLFPASHNLYSSDSTSRKTHHAHRPFHTEDVVNSLAPNRIAAVLSCWCEYFFSQTSLIKFTQTPFVFTFSKSCLLAQKLFLSCVCFFGFNIVFIPSISFFRSNTLHFSWFFFFYSPIITFRLWVTNSPAPYYPNNKKLRNISGSLNGENLG